jgi:hypothetical protein
MFADEARFGRMNRPRPCWAPIGIRPEVATVIHCHHDIGKGKDDDWTKHEKKKEHFGSEARCSWYEKKWINAFLKRLALIDLASTNIKDGTAREEICKTIKGYRKLVPDLRDKAAWPDAKLPYIVKSSIRSLELSVAVIQFGLDSLRLSLRLAMLYRNQEVHVFPAFLLGCGSLLTLTVFLVLPATWQLSAMWSA